MIELRTLGSLTADDPDGRGSASPLTRSKPLGLLVYLTLAQPRGYRRRDVVLPVFWPELGQTHARTALRKALHILRQHLGEQVVLNRGVEEIGVDRSLVWCDAIEFENAISAGRLADALALYRGTLLEGVYVAGAPDFEDWLELERARLRQSAIAAAWRLAESTQRAGSVRAAADWARRAVALALFDEAAVRRLIALLAGTGDRAGALWAADDLAARLKREYGTEPAPETAALIDSIRNRVGDVGASEPLAPPVYSGVPDLDTRVQSRSSITVLPFLNLTGDADFEYFCDGMTEELTSTLARTGHLRVVARTSAFLFKGREIDVRRVGDALGARTVIEGSIRRVDSRIRVTVQLVDTASGYHLWAENYDQDFDDVIAVQNAIARDVVTVLRSRLDEGWDALLSRRAAESRQVYQLHLKGHYHLRRRSPDDIRKAIRYFEEAIRLSPDHAPSHAGLAVCWSDLPVYTGMAPREAYPRAKNAAERALELDDSIAAAHMALAFAVLVLDWDWKTAEQAIDRALELDPSLPYARSWKALYMLAPRGRFHEAITEIRGARSDDPLSLPINAYVGMIDFFAGRYDDAIEAARQALDLDAGLPLAHWVLGMAGEMSGDLQEAIACFQRAADLTGQSPLMLAQLARALARAGRLGDAREILPRIAGSDGSLGYFVGPTHLMLGDTDQAVRCLDAAFRERSNYILMLGVDPFYDPLRSHPDVRAMLQRIGLPSMPA